MIIEELVCDVCGIKGAYPKIRDTHCHPELKIDGIPQNIWTPMYKLKPNGELTIDSNQIGVYKFINYLPNQPTIITLNEGNTPLIDITRLFSKGQIYLKDESKNPTGSFKDRGMPLLISECIDFKKKIVAIPSTGNAAISLTVYANHAGIKPIVFVPESIRKEKLNLIDGEIIFDKNLMESFNHFFKECASNPEIYNGFVTHNIPYTQGLKTAAFEVFVQLGNKVPNYVIIPCGSGGNILGYYNGFKDLLELGLTNKIPKIVPVQILGADPITQGFIRDLSTTCVLENYIESRAESIASDTNFNYIKIMNILKKTKSEPLSVTDSDIDKTYQEKSFPELEFSSRSVYAAMYIMEKRIEKDSLVILIGTAKQRK